MNNTQDFLLKCTQDFEKQFKNKDDLQFFIGNNHENCEIYIQSSKQNLEYRIGFFNQRLYISVPIYQACYPVFRLMDNEFWLKMLEINHFAKFSFFQNVSFDEKIQNKANKIPAKSSIFELIKVFVLSEEYQEYSVDMGNFDVEFNMEKLDNDLINDVVKALNILYYLNKELAKKCTPQFISKNYLSNI